MKLIAKDEELIGLLNGDLTLLSSKLSRINILTKNETLVIEMYLELLYSKGSKNIQLVFLDVEEYSFYHNSKHIFYNVESFKCFIDNGRIYISLDPYEEDEVVDSNDQDFVLSRNIEGYFLEVEN